MIRAHWLDEATVIFAQKPTGVGIQTVNRHESENKILYLKVLGRIGKVKHNMAEGVNGRQIRTILPQCEAT